MSHGKTRVPINSLAKGTVFRLKSDGIVYVMEFCMKMPSGKYLCKFYSDFTVAREYKSSKLVLLGI